MLRTLANHWTMVVEVLITKTTPQKLILILPILNQETKYKIWHIKMAKETIISFFVHNTLTLIIKP